MEQLSAELGLVVDHLCPNYERAAAEAGLSIEQLGTELVLGGWSPKNDGHGICQERQLTPLLVQSVGGQLAAPGEPLQAVMPSMAQAELVAHARPQAKYLGRKVAGGSVLAGFLQRGQAVVRGLGEI
ncbi:hypothetical protein EN794_011840 [Mesorhizobium sp. M00.F.Ca.ET.151.01.1.1]|nr:hypothetical protein EN842_09440 [bacterium M00.F.Ca.ET.199.01.1.1]TGT07928.1 hypothetical protein EN820_07675 [bacterium M00.F.Ca.ET.177.01.1.1]TGT65176.1 hypothetical protein EN813_007680 [Mesorhizobium sp. M00.F.Ca.ET.170.01.1.1]TGU15320.1 hypothetical protein EN806_07685 [bacterium M00.F.Ca.ET.163.01.1.1]TGU98033.1 hypothetical protein EN794_011840 [Mesorhizobium sp. M00.F.Ca.ET.151.01.1.1]TGV59732.1 hypothetical protein EN784_13230 [bacterium M00.F.Ca.ET.141.01.1.1]